MLRQPRCARGSRASGGYADAVHQKPGEGGQPRAAQDARRPPQRHVPRLRPRIPIMAAKVFMEALSPTMEEGKLVKWLKSEGDAVKSGEPLGEVETDKAIMELVARGDGVLRKRLINEGDSVPVGTLVGVIANKDENIDELVAGAGAPAGGAAPAAGQGAQQ